ncbi:MAG TPA: serine/threonine-protein kinase, partial [Rhodothermales bacterium]|nr:serine/threonine-protein kinase [Rhodothermales bacterium]
MHASPSPEQWDQVHRLFDELVALSPEARTARLEEACHDDATLRRELEALLASYTRAGDRLHAEIALDESPGPEVQVGRYEVRRKLGAGGMGVVYEAYDARLQRTIALKFLSALSSKDEQARQRLLAEARAAAALDHPNVGTVYEVGETDDGRTFIAMALYQGETLREKIDRGPLPVDEALDYAVQIARGLAAAHAQGIVHRDVKPANIIVTEPSETETRGRVKILDFGLAKLADMHLTQTGSTLGTVYYMSPEQARGETVDQRTDIWALGIVLYEMLSKARPFQGEYAQAYLYSIMNDEPEPLAALNPDVPEDLDHILSMCLEKDRDYRYPAMVDLLHDLDMLEQGGGSELSSTRHRATTPSVRVPRLAWAGVGTLVALLLLVFSIPTLREA